MSRIEFKSVVLCEEVRREATGQAIIIGASMIGPTISSENGREIDRIAFYLEADVPDIDEVSFRLINLDNEDIPIDLNMPFDIREQLKESSIESPEPVELVGVTIVFNKDKVKFKGPGEYELQYKIDDTNWEKIRKFFFPSSA